MAYTYSNGRPCPRCGDKGVGEIYKCSKCGAIYCLKCSHGTCCPSCGAGKIYDRVTIGIKPGGVYISD